MLMKKGYKKMTKSEKMINTTRRFSIKTVSPYLKSVYFFDRIVSTGAVGMATHQTFKGKKDTLQKSVAINRFNRITRTRWIKPTHWREYRGNKILIEPDKALKKKAHHFFRVMPASARHFSNKGIIWDVPSPLAARLGVTIKSLPRIVVASA